MKIGGVKIAHECGVIAHSDGDVVLHALADAVLGASGAGDIGRLFPDTDSRYAGADSRMLLADVVARARKAGWRIVNADCTLVAEQPRIAPHIAAMCEAIAAILATGISAVNVKATSAEKMGFVGRGEGLAALAVVLLAGG